MSVHIYNDCKVLVLRMFSGVGVVYAIPAVVAMVLAGGCLGGGQEAYGLSNVSDWLVEYKSGAHGGYSFMFNSTFALDLGSSYDSSLATSLVFIQNSSQGEGSVIMVGVVPSFLMQGGWLDKACDREGLKLNLRSQENLNVTEVKSITDRDFGNVRSCIAEATSMQDGVEIPLIVSFAECRSRLPVYVAAGGGNTMNNVELILSSFDC